MVRCHSQQVGAMASGLSCCPLPQPRWTFVRTSRSMQCRSVPSLCDYNMASTNQTITYPYPYSPQSRHIARVQEKVVMHDAVMLV